MMEAEGSRREKVAGIDDKQQITATFAVSLDSMFFRCFFLPEKTNHSHPKYVFDGFDIYHTPNH